MSSTPRSLQFTKMHGIGNDFVMVDCLKTALPEESLSDIAVRACNRRTGIGADGLILILPSRNADFRMRVINSDGSEAEMCGNGIRCFAKYVFDRKMVGDVRFTAETLAGVKPLKVTAQGGKAQSVRVDMGPPRLRRSEIPMRGDEAETVVAEPLKVNGSRLSITAVSMGNPHAVVFDDHVERVDLVGLGPKIETHPSFPQKTNVQFVQVLGPAELRVRTWERGAGVTFACGTGACASLVAASLNGKSGKRALVHLPGGDLQVEWLGDNRLVMTGPAEEVFEGEMPL